MNFYKIIIATAFALFLPILLHAQSIQEWTSEFAVRYGDYRDETFTIRVLVAMEPNDYANAEFVFGSRAGGELLPAMIFFLCEYTLACIEFRLWQHVLMGVRYQVLQVSLPVMLRLNNKV